MVEIWLVGPYYSEYQKRKGWLFNDNEKGKLFALTQELQRNWPRCSSDRQTPPEVGMQSKLYYVKCDFVQPKAIFRIAFGFHPIPGTEGRIVALTCRTKEELAQGAQDGTMAWYQHMTTVGRARWSDYQRGFITAWRIYKTDGSPG